MSVTIPQKLILIFLVFSQAHEHYNILCSMSRVATSTNNSIAEALDSWVKEEGALDFLPC